MLVLSRKVNESLILPGVATSFSIRDIRGNAVRVAIQAPKSVEILREELLTDNVVMGNLLIHEPIRQILLQLEQQIHNNSRDEIIRSINLMKGIVGMD